MYMCSTDKRGENTGREAWALGAESALPNCSYQLISLPGTAGGLGGALPSRGAKISAHGTGAVSEKTLKESSGSFAFVAAEG